MSSQQPQPIPFRSVAVLGPGLLGGSIAMAVQQLMPGCHLRLWARRSEPLEQARRLGITPHTFRDAQDAVRGAELTILATPVGTFADLARSILPALSPGALVTDVGSVKAAVHQSAGRIIEQAGTCFIGSHPMAGGEKQGLEHARADLLHHATVALTPPPGAPAELLARLTRFWQALGCTTCTMSPEQHDQAVARISHMPHIVAALCARAAVQGNVPAEDLQRLASTGFRDTTRVSSGGAAMWADILCGNSPAIRSALEDCIADLRHMADLLAQQDKTSIRTWLEQAKDARESVRRDS